MRTSIMASTIILCFMFTILSILTINSYSHTKVAQQETLNNIVDSAIESLQLDNVYNKDNYEKLEGDMLQLLTLSSEVNGKVDVKFLEINTKEGLIDVEITKTYNWLGMKKKVTSRRLVLLEEYETPAVETASVMFVYYDSTGNEIVWREDESFVGAILKRPKNPKKQGYTFKGWSTTENGEIIGNEEWQNYIVENENTIFYAIFEQNS